MKRSIALIIALAVSAISLSLMNNDSTARAQKQNKFTADTGILTLGPNQILRITVVNGGKADSKVRFRKVAYAPGADQLLHDIGTGDGFTQPVSLAPGEAASIDIPNTSFGIRGVAFMDYSDDVCVRQIIDATTGSVVTLNGDTQGGEAD
jgi:hypothetical protein